MTPHRRCAAPRSAIAGGVAAIPHLRADVFSLSGHRGSVQISCAVAAASCHRDSADPAVAPRCASTARQRPVNAAHCGATNLAGAFGRFVLFPHHVNYHVEHHLVSGGPALPPATAARELRRAPC